MALRIDSMEITLSKTLSDYADNVSTAVAAEVEKAGKVALKEVKSRSPKKTGKYQKGWKIKKEQGAISGDVASVTIYNADRGYLTHLLENGHQKRNGGRVEGIPHIAPAEDAAAKSLEDGVRQIIETTGV